MRTVIKLDLFVSIYYKSTFRGAFLLYNTNGHATMDTRPVNQFTNCPLFSPLLLISSIIDDVHQIHSKMITLEITIEEAKAYAEALDRALDNPFIQDDDECSPLFTLSGKLDGAIDAELDPVV